MLSGRETLFRAPFVEGTQRGYAVGLVLRTGKRVDLAYYHDDGTTKGIDESYRLASGAAESIKRGKFVCRTGQVTKRGVFRRAIDINGQEVRP